MPCERVRELRRVVHHVHMLCVCIERAHLHNRHLLGLAHRLAGPDTLYLFPKGRQAEDELTGARRYWTIRDLRLLPSKTDPAARILSIRGLEPA